jgi:hypothetical protein
MSKQTELVGLARTTNLDEVNAAYSAGALSNRNAIINGECQVSQRGDYSTATAYVNGAYHLDRWKMGATRTGTIQHLGRSARFTATGSTATAYIEVVQFVEDWDYYKGKTVTASAYVTSNTANAKLYLYDGVSVKDIASHTGDGTEQHLSTTVTLSAAATELRFIVSVTSVGGGNVSIAAGEYIEFTQAQLEVGSQATPFEHRSFAQELALCERYYNEFGGTPYGGIATGMQQATTISSAGITFPTMRAAPSIGFYSLIATDRTIFDNPATQNGSIAGTKSAYLRFTHAACGAPRDAIILTSRGDAWGKLTLDAEL